MTAPAESLLLTPAEVADLTGYVKPSAQTRWLSETGIPFLVGGDGKPKVLRRLVMERLGYKFDGQPVRREPQLRL